MPITLRKVNNKVIKDTYNIQVWDGTYYTNSKGNLTKHRYSEIFHGKKKEAEKRESELITQFEKCTFINNKDLTYNDLIDKWHIEIAISSLELKTLEEYDRQLKQIRKEIGCCKLKELKAIHFLQFYNRLRKKDLSENTVKHYYALNNTILNYGVKWEMVEKNYNSLVDCPKVEKREVRYYDEEDIEKLLDCIKKEPLKYQVIIQLALDSGCRRGELTGLEWDDIDFKTSSISITKTTQCTKRKGVIQKDHPKNSSSIRKITISERTLTLLEKYKKEQDQLKDTLGSEWENSNKVLINNTGGLMHPDTPSKIFKKIQDKYNLKNLNFHGLRHTSASMLISTNNHMKVISKRLGHASQTTTDTIYSHIFVSAEVEASNRMAEKYF